MRDNSLLFWFPKVKNLGIPVPKTEWVEISTNELLRFMDDLCVLNKYWSEIEKVATKIGFPLFLRTDLASGKHGWNKTCFVEELKDLKDHIYRVVSANFEADIMGLPARALVFREYIEMESGFTAFWGQLPISRERRYFIKDGIVVEHFPYWPEEAIEKSAFPPSRKDWKEVLKELNTETEEEIALLNSYAEKVGTVLEGYWSVDFCRARDGPETPETTSGSGWILIDCALGEQSWRPVTQSLRKQEGGNYEKAEENLSMQEMRVSRR